MPVHKSGTKNGKSCFKYGKTGKRYCGTGAKSKANKQARAIRSSQTRKK